MKNPLKHINFIIGCLFFCIQISVSQELSSEEWDAKYENWELELEKGTTKSKESNYKAAKIHLDKAITIAKLLFDEDDEDLGKTAFKLGRINKVLGQYKEAEKAYLIALKYVQLDLGKEDEAFGYIMNQLGLIYRELEDYDAAFSCANQAVINAKTNFGENHKTYVRRLNNLALVYSDIDDNDKALLLMEEVVSKGEPLFDKNSNELATFYNNLGLTYIISKDKITSAEIVLTRSINIAKANNKVFGYNYVIRLMNLASYYNKTKDYQAAFNYIQEATKIAEEHLKKHTVLLKCYNSLSTLYRQFGNKERSGFYLNKAFKFITVNKIQGTLDHASVLVNSAKDKMQTYYYEGAVEDYTEALMILEDKLGINSNRYLNVSNALTVAHLNLGEAEKAMAQSEKVLPAIEYLMGKESNLYASQLTNIGKAHSLLGAYQEALKYYSDAHVIITSIFGNKSYEFAKSLQNIANINLRIGRPEETIKYLLRANDNYIDRISEIFAFQGEKDKKEFIESMRDNYFLNQSVMIDHIEWSSEFIEMNLNNSLLLKNLVLNSSKDITKELEQLNDTELNKNIVRLAELTDQLNDELTKKKKEQSKDLEVIRSEKRNLENKLIQKHSNHFDSGIKFPDWKKIQTALGENEVSIEFSFFQYSGINEWTDKTYYAAYIIKKGWSYPKVIKLFEETEIQQIIKGISANTLYQTRGSKAKSTSTSINKSVELYNLVWKPLEVFLEHMDTVYFSPDGILNQISFAALTSSNNETLINKFSLNQLSNLISVTNIVLEPKMSDALFVGGVNYDYKLSESSTKFNLEEELTPIINSKSNRGKGETWNYLGGTLTEIKEISELLYSNNVEVWSNDYASEVNFKALSGSSPGILHIATHGFFYDKIKNKDRWKMERNSEDVVYKYAKDPLLRSGLILAGANYAWQHGSNPYEEEDGILTALEISNLDLSKTDMVVLSACETGLGDIDGSEGVYGLQRAFKMAGVDLIVMSLWEVPDKETAEFMNLFYSNWLGGMKVREAFNTTQRTMSTKYKDTPEKWAAFVLFE